MKNGFFSRPAGTLVALGLVWGAGVGVVVGLIVADGPGIALGGAFGAGLGLVVGAVVERWVSLKARKKSEAEGGSEPDH